MDTVLFLLFIAVSGGLSLATALSLHTSLRSMKGGSEKMESVASHIRRVTKIFLRKVWGVILLCLLVGGILLFFFLEREAAPLVVGNFVFGALSAFFVTAVGLRSALIASTRVLSVAKAGGREAVRVAFVSGAILSLTVMGVALFGLAVSLLALGIGAEQNLLKSPETLLGYFLGAASTALFMRVGGGIAAKAADMASDLSSLPENDPKNPVTFVDHVGDFVCHVAGLGADLFASFTGGTIAAMLIGAATIGTQSAVLFPLVIGAVGLLAGIISILCIGTKGRSAALGKTVKRGMLLVALLVLASSIFFAQQFFPSYMSKGITIALTTGILLGVIMSAIAEYYAAAHHRPAAQVAKVAESGSAAAILLGQALGYNATGPSLLLSALSLCIAFVSAGFYGIALVAVGMLACLSLPLAGSAAIPVLDTAFGIATMSQAPAPLRQLTKDLHSGGITVVARMRTFANVSGFLTALALFTAFGAATHLTTINLLHPLIFIGLLLGSLLPFLFSAMTSNAVGRSAHALIEEVRRSLRKKTPGNPLRSISITTSVALQEMIVPSLLAIVAPVSVGFLLGTGVLTGLLAGALITGFPLGVSFLQTGAVFAAAKAHAERSRKGRENGSAEALLTADALGDPYKDVTGPSLMLFLHLMLVVSLLLVGLFPATGIL